MFKIILSAAALLLLSGCSLKDAGFTPRDDLDYYGIYKGVLPCKRCMGIKTTLKLQRPNRYEKKLSYIQSAQERLYARGSFFWDGSGHSITLDDGSSYRVKENALQMLDNSGRPPANNQKAYTLKKFSLSTFINDRNASH